MQTTLENRKKATSESPKNVFKKKHRAKEGGASGSRVKRE
jgi:hypothetical protein